MSSLMKFKKPKRKRVKPRKYKASRKVTRRLSPQRRVIKTVPDPLDLEYLFLCVYYKGFGYC